VKRLLALYQKFSALLLKLLTPLGFWGIGALAILDTSSIPVPMDAFIAFYSWHDKRHFYLYVLMASIGSAIGGLVPYFIGRAGGEIFLLKRIDRVKYEALRDRFERQEFLALMIPSMLPPPTPWKLFVFGAGVFEMRVLNFMLAVFVGRIIRFGVESLLVIRYGPQIVHEVSVIAHRHMIAMIAVIAIVFGLFALYVIRKKHSTSSA
jgi:membrane protein YqaA with SNARE-associated domain